MLMKARRARSVVVEMTQLAENVESLEEEEHYISCTINLPDGHPDHHVSAALIDTRRRLQDARRRLNAVRREAQSNPWVPRLHAGGLLLRAVRGMVGGVVT